MTPVQFSDGTARTYINARFSGGELSTIRIVGSHIAGVAEQPKPGDWVVDLQGDRVLPGLINAHDHLQLNNMPRYASGKHFVHVRDWITEVGASRRSNSIFAASVGVGRNARLLIGGIKNLLSGVTTVAHHDPLYSFLSDPVFPTQAVRRYGWSHSLYAEAEDQVRCSYRRTPAEWPWIIHAAEGLNAEAAGEFERLDALGCLAPNTLLVHGVALDASQRARLAQADCGLIWCPSSNLHLFGATAQVADLHRQGRVALGTDSRLSGVGDLLDELRVAHRVGGLDEGSLEALVTCNGARLLRLPDRGSLRPGAQADILVLPADTSLLAARRADVRLVLMKGLVRYGDGACAQRAQPLSHWTPIRVDGKPKVLDTRIAKYLLDAGVAEVGLEFPNTTWRAA